MLFLFNEGSFGSGRFCGYWEEPIQVQKEKIENQKKKLNSRIKSIKENPLEGVKLLKIDQGATSLAYYTQKKRLSETQSQLEKKKDLYSKSPNEENRIVLQYIKKKTASEQERLKTLEKDLSEKRTLIKKFSRNAQDPAVREAIKIRIQKLELKLLRLEDESETLLIQSIPVKVADIFSGMPIVLYGLMLFFSAHLLELYYSVKNSCDTKLVPGWIIFYYGLAEPPFWSSRVIAI